MKTKIIIGIVIIFLFALMAYAGENDMTEFGNTTTTTAWIGGDTGNFTILGNASISGKSYFEDDMDMNSHDIDAIASLTNYYGTGCTNQFMTDVVDNGDLSCAAVEIVYDTSPQLGGNLDGNGHDISVDATDKVCLNAACTSYIYDNSTHIVIHHE